MSSMVSGKPQLGHACDTGRPPQDSPLSRKIDLGL
jgi:hypothetical protein